MKVSILLPTCGTRLELLDKMLHSLDDTVARNRYEVIAVVDESRDAVRLCMAYEVDVLDFSHTRRGALWAWNRALRLSDAPIIVPCGDDQVFHDGWLDFALESHHEKLNDSGVVGMNDLAYDGNKQVSTMFLFDRNFCKEAMGGIFAPPMLKYYCVDLWWNDKAKMLDKFYWDERSIVEHIHSAHGKRPLDSLDQEKMDAGWMEEDNKMYTKAKELGLPVTWKPII